MISAAANQYGSLSPIWKFFVMATPFWAGGFLWLIGMLLNRPKTSHSTPNPTLEWLSSILKCTAFLVAGVLCCMEAIVFYKCKSIQGCSVSWRMVFGSATTGLLCCWFSFNLWKIEREFADFKDESLEDLTDERVKEEASKRQQQQKQVFEEKQQEIGEYGDEWNQET